MTTSANRLVEGVLESIRARGLAATTSRQITSAAGVNLAGITYHYGSKDKLVAEALLGAIRTGLQPVLDILAADTDPLQRMLSAFTALEDAFEASSELVPIYVEALVHARQSRELRIGLEEILSEVHTSLRDQIAELKDRGFLPEWVEPDAMASLHLAVANGLALQTNMGGRDPRAAARQFVALLAAAAAPPTHTSTPNPSAKPRRSAGNL